jgi:hypothetical protein
MKKAKPTRPPSEEFRRFEEFTKRLMSVPKSEIDKKKAEYDRKKTKRQKAA